MSKKFILGSGVAALVAANYLNDYKYIGIKLGGQMSFGFDLGPRIIHVDNYSKKLINDLVGLDKIVIKEAQIGYKFKIGNETFIKTFYPPIFKKRYTKITRDTNEVKSSFLSDNKNIIKYFEFKDNSANNLLYNTVVERLIENTKNNYICDKIKRIDLEENIIFCENNNYGFSSLINTIPLNIFLKLINDEKAFKCQTVEKNFYLCKKTSNEDIALSKKFSYIYSIIDPYSRKTYSGDYIIYESPKQIDSFEGNILLKKIEKLKIQIKNPTNFEQYKGVKMLGRYAQWNHKVKINNIAQSVLGWL